MALSYQELHDIAVKLHRQLEDVNMRLNFVKPDERTEATLQRIKRNVGNALRNAEKQGLDID